MALFSGTSPRTFLTRSGIVGLLWLWLTPAVFAVDRLCRGEFQQKLETHLQQPGLNQAQWGIVIQPLEEKFPLYSHQGDTFFIPASNQKLITTAIALQRLGADFRFTTKVYQSDDGKKVQIITSGDPTLQPDDLKAIADVLKARNGGVIDELVLVDRIAPEDDRRPSWEWDDLHYGYAPPVNQAILAGNEVNLTLTPGKVGEPLAISWSDPLAGKQWEIVNNSQTSVTPDQFPQVRQVFGQRQLVITGALAPTAEPRNITLAIADPRQYFLDTLGRYLADQSIFVKKITLSTTAPAIAKEPLLTLSSPPLGELIKTVNQDSDNLYGETLLNALQLPPHDPASWDPYGESIGLSPGEIRLRDGSGLSRQNLVTPQTLVKLLINQAQNPTGPIYLDSLAVAGRSGTLRQRFLATPLEDKVQAKTGTLTGVVALSGYLENESWGTVVFSFMVNNSNLSAPLLREALEQMVVWSAEVQKCD